MHAEFPALYGSNFTNVATISGRIQKAIQWPDLRNTKRPTKPWLDGFPRFVFVGDMGDFLSREISDDYVLNEIFANIANTSHFWLLLTKRPTRLAHLARQFGGLPSNVMAMTTITDQRTANIRIPALQSVTAHWRGISAEPLLGEITLPDTTNIHWLITGGESGEGANLIEPTWVHSLQNQCRVSHIPFFFKQWGGSNKKAAGRSLNGKFYSEMPKVN